MAKAQTNSRHWTIGCEHELADWDTRKGWLEDEGFGRDPEPNIGNSNGIATDPSLKSYPFGGEINTPATRTVEDQLELLDKFIGLHPDAVPTYRSGVHVHIRVPGLREDLAALKRVQSYITRNTDVYPLIDVMPEVPKEKKAERKRWNWMKMSHWTKIPADRVAKQMKARTVDEFFKLEVPKMKNGDPAWACQPRAAVNLRQLLQTDTVEFRHWTQSISYEEIENAIRWCVEYLKLAIRGSEQTATRLFEKKFSGARFPTLADYPFAEYKEERWRATTITKNSRVSVERNIAAILSGRFDEYPY